MTAATMLRAGALGIVALLAACGSSERNGALDDLPDEAGLTLEVAGTAPSALTEALSDATGSALTLDQTPVTTDDLAAARAKVAAVNDAIRTVLGHVKDVVDAGGAPSAGDTKTYGPVTRCIVSTACDAGGSASLRLRVYRGAGGTWVFGLEADVGGAWKPVLAGWMRRAPETRRGTGRIAVNLENLRGAAPAYPGHGYLLGGFANRAVAKVLHYHLVGFTPDPSRWPATTAVFRGFKTAAGVTRVRVAGIENLYGGAGTEAELGFGHVTYDPAVGGRAYAVVTNYRAGGTWHGDVPRSTGGVEQYFFGRACYAPGIPTPAYKEWFLCQRGVGPRACVEAQGGVGTPVLASVNQSWQTACAPSDTPELQAPDAAPGETAEDASDEAGVAATGLQPETPPASPDDVAP